MAAKIKKSKIVCVSHREDCDGISSAALIKQAFGGETILTDYPGMMDDMEPLRNDESLKELYICDLGLNKKNECDFVELLTHLRKRSVKISYLDHHDLDRKIINQLKKIKVNVVHDTNECASVQVYDKYKKKLDDHAAFIAACAAITDYMEDRPLGSKLLQIFDRQFALISATVMTYNIVGHQKDPDYLLYLVDELSESKDSGASGAVNFVLGLSGKDVGVAYKERVDYGVYAVSVRGSKQCKIHLGRLINKITTEIGGSGGGHDKACGASIPKNKITKFLNTLNSSLAK